MAQGSALLYSVACARRSGGKRCEASRTAISSAWPVASPSGQPKALPASARTASRSSTINAAKGCLPRAFAAAASAMVWRRYCRSRAVAAASIPISPVGTAWTHPSARRMRARTVRECASQDPRRRPAMQRPVLGIALTNTSHARSEPCRLCWAHGACLCRQVSSTHGIRYGSHMAISRPSCRAQGGTTQSARRGHRRSRGMQEPFCGLVVLFCDLTGIHRGEMAFFDNALAGDHRVIHIDGLPKDNRGHGIVHAGETKAIEIDGAEVRALAPCQTANILSAQDCRTATRAERERFARSHQGALGIVGEGIPREALFDPRD